MPVNQAVITKQLSHFGGVQTSFVEADTNLFSKSPLASLYQRGARGDFRLQLKATWYQHAAPKAPVEPVLAVIPANAGIQDFQEVLH
jgi:hypothetical protein